MCRAEATAIYSLQKHGVQIWSYRELSVNVLALARRLVKLGVRKGDGVALLAFNRSETIVAALCDPKSGCGSRTDRCTAWHTNARIYLIDSQVRIAFVTEDHLARFEALASTQSLQLIVYDGDEANPHHWRQLVVGEEVVLPEVYPANAAALFYTSGTTGQPKGVPLTHANIIFSFHSLFQTRVTLTDDRLLLLLLLHHVFPFVCGMLLPLALGLTIVLPHALTGPQIV